MSTTEAKLTNNGAIEDLDVIVVGAGFAGLSISSTACAAWA
jgi:succinate dehydrogenase/fumarate reductase flavoprotein subunit